jgi:hypothetical protein
MKSRLMPGIFLALLVAGAATVAIIRQSTPPATETPMRPPTMGPPMLDPDEEIAYVCPIHPDFTSEVSGTCPRDGMVLVEANPYDVRDYVLEFETEPAVVRAGEPARLGFRIFHPGTGELVKDFVTVHDERYHLFLISQNLEHFEHLHPEQGPDGAWSIDVTFPEGGHYKLLSDFVPHGGSSQFIAQPLVTANYEGDLTADAARLVADVAPTQSSGDLTATASYDPETLIAGLYGHLTIELAETESGRPVTDLQPYLGSFGHLLIMSDDLVHYVHSHPLDMENSDDETGPLALMLPMGVDVSRFRGGPGVTFEGLMPKPGLYRAWAQFQRRNEVYTFAFTFAVAASE